MTAPRTIGNRLAPPKFIAFFVLLFAGIAFGQAYMERARAIMISFDVAAVVFLIWCLPLFRYHAAAMRQAASENDGNRVTLLIASIVVSLVILVTIAGELVKQTGPTFADKLLIVVTLALAWIGTNMVYTLHYAHLYYSSDDGGQDHGGLDFPGKRPEPDYFDFVYFAFTLGVALQTSDVMVTSPAMRRIVIIHCLEAFIFNTGVLAMAISILTQ